MIMHVELITPVLKSSLCGYSDRYIPVKETMTVVGQGADAATIAIDGNNEEVTLKSCAPFNDCISEINKKQLDKANGLGCVMPKYNLVEYNNCYSKASGNLSQYYRDDPC